MSEQTPGHFSRRKFLNLVTAGLAVASARTIDNAFLNIPTSAYAGSIKDIPGHMSPEQQYLEPTALYLVTPDGQPHSVTPNQFPELTDAFSQVITTFNETGITNWLNQYGSATQAESIPSFDIRYPAEQTEAGDVVPTLIPTQTPDTPKHPSHILVAFDLGGIMYEYDSKTSTYIGHPYTNLLAFQSIGIVGQNFELIAPPEKWADIHINPNAEGLVIRNAATNMILAQGNAEITPEKNTRIHWIANAEFNPYTQEFNEKFVSSLTGLANPEAALGEHVLNFTTIEFTEPHSREIWKIRVWGDAETIPYPLFTFTDESIKNVQQLAETILLPDTSETLRVLSYNNGLASQGGSSDGNNHRQGEMPIDVNLNEINVVFVADKNAAPELKTLAHSFESIEEDGIYIEPRTDGKLFVYLYPVDVNSPTYVNYPEYLYYGFTQSVTMVFAILRYFQELKNEGIQDYTDLSQTYAQFLGSGQNAHFFQRLPNDVLNKLPELVPQLIENLNPIQ